MHGDSTGLQQGGLVRPGLRTVRRMTGQRLAQHIRPNALRGLRRAQRGAVEGRADPAAVDPLDRLDDRHDRDGGAVLRGGTGDRADQGRRDGRSAAVVDEHDPRVGVGPGRRPAVDRRRRRRIEPRQPRGDRVLATLPARDDGVDLGRQPRRSPDHSDRVGRDHEDDPLDLGRGGEGLERPGEQRPVADRGHELVDAGHPARRTRRHDHRVGAHGRTGQVRGVPGHGRDRRRAATPDAAGRRSSARPRSGGRA